LTSISGVNQALMWGIFLPERVWSSPGLHPGHCLSHETLSHGEYSGLDQTIPRFNLDRLLPAQIIPGLKANLLTPWARGIL